MRNPRKWRAHYIGGTRRGKHERFTGDGRLPTGIE